MAENQRENANNQNRSAIPERRVRRPQNAFMIFSNEFREQVSEQNPNVDNRGVSIILGRRWRAMSPLDKRSYFRRAAELDRQHKQENPGYVYNPWAARKLKQKLKDQQFMRKWDKPFTPVSDDMNHTENLKHNTSKMIVCAATDEPPNRAFRPLLAPFDSLSSVETPVQKTQNIGTVHLQNLFTQFCGLFGMQTTVTEVPTDTNHK